MSIMDFFSSQGTASPSPDSETGDWIDWFLNREGPAGRFKGSRRPRYDIDYLFNGGGSVQSRPSYRSVQSGPKTRQKLQPRSSEAIVNSAQNRQNRNQRRWEDAGGEGPYPVWNKPNPWERSHSLDDMSSGWLEASAPIDNTGVMATSNGSSWIENNPWLLSLMASRHGDPSELEGMGLGGDGLFKLFGGDWDIDVGRGENDSWNLGITGKWNTPKWLGG